MDLGSGCFGVCPSQASLWWWGRACLPTTQLPPLGVALCSTRRPPVDPPPPVDPLQGAQRRRHDASATEPPPSELCVAEGVAPLRVRAEGVVTRAACACPGVRGVVGFPSTAAVVGCTPRSRTRPRALPVHPQRSCVERCSPVPSRGRRCPAACSLRKPPLARRPPSVHPRGVRGARVAPCARRHTARGVYRRSPPPHIWRGSAPLPSSCSLSSISLWLGALHAPFTAHPPRPHVPTLSLRCLVPFPFL